MIVAAIAIAATIADVVSTWLALRSGTGYERNGAAAGAFGTLGLEPVLLLGLVARVLIVCGLVAIVRQRQHRELHVVAMVVLAAAAAWWLVIVSGNVFVLSGLA